jgi:hypothetical protein
MKVSKRAPFWDRVSAHTVVGDNGCHIFTGTKDDCGYGRIGRDGRYVRVHREVWVKHNGQIPAGMCVCHKCDTPACVNIDHLFLGTHGDNMADRARKGRYNNKGSKNPSAKLTEIEVACIKKLLREGATQSSLGREFGVSASHIGLIASGRAWA